MKKGPSPIKAKIISDFLQRFSNRKEAEQLVTNSLQESKESSRRKMLRKVHMQKDREIIQEVVEANNYSRSIERDIDDIVGNNSPMQQINYQRHSVNQREEKSKQIQQQQKTQNQKATEIEVSKQRQKLQSLNLVKGETNFIRKKREIIQVITKQKQTLISSTQKLQEHIITKQKEVENITNEKDILMQKNHKLEQDLARQEKELTRKVNQLNSITLEREVFLNFITNFTNKLQQFTNPQENIVEIEIKTKPQTSRSPARGRSRQKKITSYSSSSLVSALQSISEYKEITLIQSINLNILDQLTKSMQKGLSKSELYKNSEKLISTFKKFIQEIRTSQQHQITNLKLQNNKLQKQFENQRLNITKIQKLYEVEKAKVDKLNQVETNLNQEIKQIQQLHQKCGQSQTQFKKEVQSIKLNLKRVKQDLGRKETKLKEVQEKLKSTEDIIHQQQQQKQQMNRLHEQQIRKKAIQILNLNKTHQKVLKSKQSETQSIKKSLDQAHKKISQLQKNLDEKKQNLLEYKENLLQKQLMLKQQNNEVSLMKQNMQRNLIQREKYEFGLNQKECKIEEIKHHILQKDKKLFEVDFTKQLLQKEISSLRQQLKKNHTQLIKISQSQAKQKEDVIRLQKQNSSLNQESARWKQKYEQVETDFKTKAGTAKSLELSSQKQINKLKSQIQILQQQNKAIFNENCRLEKLIFEVQTKVKIIENSTQSDKMKEKQQFLRKFAEVQSLKCNFQLLEKEKSHNEQYRFLQDKYNLLNESFWKEKEINSLLKQKKQTIISQNEQLNHKLTLFHQGIQIIQKRSIKINLLFKKPQDLLNESQTNIQKQDIVKIFDQQEPQFAMRLRSMKHQRKTFIQIMKNLAEINQNIKLQSERLKLSQLKQRSLQKIVEEKQINFIQIAEKNKQVDLMKTENEQLVSDINLKERTLNSLHIKISELEYDLTFQKQREKRLIDQKNKSTTQAKHEKDLREKQNYELKMLKQQNYLLKEYQLKKLNEKCNQLQSQLQNKTDQLRQTYAFLETHLS